MTEIKFARDYGYAPPAPFWLVWNEAGHPPMHKHHDRESAETEAARLASISPGATFHVLVVMSMVSTSMDVVGTRFDPNRQPAQISTVEEEQPAPSFIAEPEDLAFDGKPF